jgi:plasmid maintenance system antidote protein VapI
METTFDKFITEKPEQKKKFDKEYSNFMLSEFILEKMEEEKLSVRALAKSAGVSPTVIQKIRSPRDANKITYNTFINVMNTLGYGIKIVRL